MILVSPPNSDIQCNEISSTEDPELKTPAKSRSRNPASAKSQEQKTPGLSRELSALQLSSTPPLLPRRGGRTRSDSNSDTENEAPIITKHKRVNPIKEMREKCFPNPRFLRSKEAKVKKSVALNNLTSSTASPTTVMSLRPRPASTGSSSSRKRKPELLKESEDIATTPLKSPKMMQVVNTKPVMTRSRTARVLQLKK